MPSTSRRQFLAQVASQAALIAASPRLLHAAAKSRIGSLPAAIARMEKQHGGRVGFFLIDTASDQSTGYRENERFPMCSTFKMVLAAATLARVDSGQEQLDRRISIRQSDILSYAPITSKHTGSEGLTIAELCDAAISVSDNTAANLLLAQLDGPEALTRFTHSLGDRTFRLDRNEPSLNEATPGDPRDTTTPAAMAGLLHTLVLGKALTPASRQQLKNWLLRCQTGAQRTRAGMPPDWKLAEKTGSGDHGTINDIAVIYPSGNRPPLVLTVYTTGNTEPAEAHALIFKEIGEAVTKAIQS